MALELMPIGLDQYYDLFCDHGLLGLALLERGDPNIYFNDKKSDLINALKLNHQIKDNYLLDMPAQEIDLLPSSGIFMLGVGGILMSEVLRKWDEKGLIIDNQYFLLGPNYYELKLRACLRELGFSLIKRSFVWEGGHGYEFFLVQKKLGEVDNTNLLKFDPLYWEEQLKSCPHAKTHLLKKYTSLNKKRELTRFEGNFKASLGTFLTNFNIS